jgi:hypothetical protein
MALPDELKSRKLAGLVIVLTMLVLLFVAYIVASIWVDVSDAVISVIASTMGSLGIGHQAAQSAQDRAQAYSPNHPVTPPKTDKPSIEELLNG